MGCNNSKEAIEGASGGGGRSGISMNPANNVNHEESQAMHIAARKGAKRNNVIAQTDLESDFDAPVFAKSSHQEKVIKDCITGPDAFFFTDIGDAELTMLVNAMQPRDIKSGDEVITQGDPGDYFYVIEDGSYAAYVNGKKVKDYSKGMFFW